MSSNCKHPTCGDTCRRTQEPKRARKPIPRYSAKPKENKSELEAFFYDCVCIIAAKPRCFECNDFIHPMFYKHAVAHLLPKSIFPSIATHPLNWLPYGASCGCHSKTHRLDTFSQMNTFKFAVNRFRQFEHLITENHKLLDEFRQYASMIEL